MGIKSITLAVLAVSTTATLTINDAQAGLLDPVSIGDREWRQLTDTIYFTYDELASIYDTSTGHLSGSTTTLNNDLLGEVDFSGWTWASLTDVFNLFEQIPGHNLVPETSSNWDPTDGGEANSTLGDFFEASFEPTDYYDEQPSWGWLNWYGWTRDQSGNNFMMVGFERNDIRSDDGDTWLRNQDQILYYELPVGSYPEGAWLYRDVPAIPIPPAVWLFGTGLIGLICIARRKKS